MAMIKANAYGHGLLGVARLCARENVDFLGVALLEEALQIRGDGIETPVLILGYTPPQELRKVVEQGFRQTVYDLASAEELSKAAQAVGREAFVHIKVDTGMSRVGFLPGEEALQSVTRIMRMPGLVIEGLYTHFAMADSPDSDYTELQFARFMDFVDRLAKMGIKIPILHAANSAGIINHPYTQLDMVRAGISLYGLRPSEDTELGDLKLIPAMRLISRVVLVKEVEAGTPVSYGCTFVTKRRSRLATVLVGYGDGYTRLYSNRVHAAIRGQRVPQVGRVCMDSCVFDVTDVDHVEVGDEVVLFGRPEDGVTADELARAIGTINYEVVCLINDRVPRIYRE